MKSLYKKLKRDKEFINNNINKLLSPKIIIENYLIVHPMILKINKWREKKEWLLKNLRVSFDFIRNYLKYIINIKYNQLYIIFKILDMSKCSL